MNNSTKAMVLDWIAKDDGNPDRTARWMAKTLKIGSLKECRALIKEVVA